MTKHRHSIFSLLKNCEIYLDLFYPFR